MSSGLLNQVNNAEQAGQNALNHTPDRVLVFVESEQDILFWKGILAKEYPNKDFIVTPYVSGEIKGKGKPRILEMARNGRLGPSMIGCVDSDNDWLLEKWTADGTTICQNDYLLQTFAYALENIALAPAGLSQSLLESCYHDDELLRTIEKEYSDFLQVISETLYPVLIWHLLLIKENQDVDKVGEAWRDLLKKGKYTDIVNETNVPLREKFEKVMGKLKTEVETFLQSYAAAYSELEAKIEEFEKDMREGYRLTEENAYLHVHAHALYDFISHTFFVVVEKYARDNHLALLTQCLDPKAINDAVRYYKNLTQPLGSVRMRKAQETIHSLPRYKGMILGNVRSLVL